MKWFKILALTMIGVFTLFAIIGAITDSGGQTGGGVKEVKVNKVTVKNLETKEIEKTKIKKPTEKETYTVSEVIDGDTIKLNDGEYVRYIGMDTPEMGNCFASTAYRVNKKLVEGKEIVMKKDTSNTDRYGRLLRYVYVGDTFVNKYLVEKGYAKVATYYPDDQFESVFVRKEEKAKTLNIGLWSKCE